MTAKYEPNDKDRALVKSYTAVGIRQEHVALILGITEKTLRKYYRLELDTAGIEANAAVGGTLFRMATSGECPAATIFWGKTKMGLREKDPVLEQAPSETKIVFNKGETRKSVMSEKDPDKKNGTE